MPNPIYDMMAKATPLGNMQSMMNQFNQFRQMFNGNPEQMVKQMLQNGKMTQSQFDQYAQMANELRKMIK